MARRGNHEGTLTLRSDGRWMARISLPDGTRKAFYAATRAAAQGKMRAGLRELDAGGRPGRDDVTVAGLLARWLDATEGQGKPSHRLRCEQIVRLHLAPAPLGRIRLGRLTAEDVERWQLRKLAEDVSPTTVRLMHVTLRVALKWAVRRRLAGSNVAADVALPTPAGFRGTAWTVDEALAVLAAAAGDDLEVLYVLALTTAMRQGELLGLRWADVDLDAGRLTVRSALERVGNRSRIGTPKSRQSRRTVPLTALAVESLRRHRAAQRERRLKAGPLWDDLDLVIPNALGRPLNPASLRTRSWLPLIERAGVRRVRFHDMRDTAASLLYALGADDRLVRDLLGHASVETTHRHYIHVQPDDPRLIAVVERLGSALTPVLTPTPRGQGRRDGTS